MNDEAICRIASAFRSPEDDEKELKVTERGAIGRLCGLMGAVREQLGGAADCICPTSYRDPTGYRNDGKAIEFIERATQEALAALNRGGVKDV
jgi:hypothetical protein